jgi:hypothetical protein
MNQFKQFIIDIQYWASDPNAFKWNGSIPDEWEIPLISKIKLSKPACSLYWRDTPAFLYASRFRMWKTERRGLKSKSLIHKTIQLRVLAFWATAIYSIFVCWSDRASVADCFLTSGLVSRTLAHQGCTNMQWINCTLESNAQENNQFTLKKGIRTKRITKLEAFFFCYSVLFSVSLSSVRSCASLFWSRCLPPGHQRTQLAHWLTEGLW